MRGIFSFKSNHPYLRVTAFLLASVLTVWGQGSLVYQRYYTANPDPNFPWDSEGQRVLSLNPVSMNIDVNQDGIPDYTIATGGATSTSGFYIYGLSSQNKVLSTRPFDSVFALALNDGAQISDTPSGGNYWSDPNYLGGVPLGSVFTASVNIGSLGFYTGVPSAYCGLQLQVGGQTHYGWVRVGSPIGLNGGWVYDSVFNSTPGESLFAGAGRVPEPAAASLFVVGAALLLRKRHHSSSNS